MISLRRRAIAGGMLWAAVTILLGLAGLWSFMLSETEQRFTDLLQNRHTQVVVAVGNYNDNPENISRAIADPVYQRRFAGQYWQVENDEGIVLASQSLGDARLPRPGPPTGDVKINEFSGPNGDMLLGIGQWLTLADGSTWHVQVASNLWVLNADLAGLRTNLLVAFFIILSVGIVGALVQVTVVLQPLNALRADVTKRWDDDEGMEAAAYPIEVAPLVTDINNLLQRNRDIIGRSRRQAADLAHAIKTPSAIMRNELATLQSQGQPVSESLNALDRLDAQLKRSLARMRADGSQSAMPVFTDATAALARMVRAFTSLASNAERTLSSDITPDLRLRMDQSDLEEVLGNLLDNALKWSKSKVNINAVRDDTRVVIRIEDDGPGIAETDMARATLSGQRLDTVQPGTGLGLAIANDLTHVYGGRLSLERSEMYGGLCAVVTLDAAPPKPQL
jgi:signal transduction histidine kinase